MQLLQWQARGTEISRRCTVCCVCHFNGCGKIFSERKVDVDQCFLNYTRHCPQQSTSSTMSENFMPAFVYQRRRNRKNSVAFFKTESSAGPKTSDACHSALCSEAPIMPTKEHLTVSECATDGVRSPVVLPIENDKIATVSSNGFFAVEETGFEEPLTTDIGRILNDCSANDNCSSSKSNLELSSATLKIHIDDAGECSSSGALISEKAPEEISERDVCVSILRSQGILDKVPTRQDGAPNTGHSSKNFCSKTCKVCDHMESTKNMLICDNCDDAFHPSCHIPRITILPVSEWLCTSCLKKKHKILNDKSTSNTLVNTGTESGRNRCSASELDLGSLEFMFKDTEPYMSNVRIGDKFQAAVPVWHGPAEEECNLIGDPLEVDTCNTNMQDRDTIKPLKVNPIGNWVQCREVVEGAGEGIDGTVCAKWRRAPLFEVQTDNWECFRCVLWNPAHADCGVPQELDTEDIMKQLKYVEMLRPQLAAKRRKVDRSKGSGSQELSR